MYGDKKILTIHGGSKSNGKTKFYGLPYIFRDFSILPEIIKKYNKPYT